MRSVTSAGDWFEGALREQYGLLATSPLSAQVNSWRGPGPLRVNIHDGLEVGIQLSGTAERHFEDYVLPGVPGDVWLSAMWEPHGRRVTTPYAENVVLIFLPEFLGDEKLGDLPWLALFAVPPGQRPSVSSPDIRARLLAIGEELRYEISSKPRAWTDAVRLLLLRLLLVLSRGWSPPPGSPASRRIRPGDLRRVMPALTLLRARPGHRVSLKEAAAACSLSRSHFALVFQEATGVSFARFSLRFRLGIVAHQLLVTTGSTENLAHRFGFVDGSHLHRLFVRHYGRTPGQYRAQGQ